MSINCMVSNASILEATIKYSWIELISLRSNLTSIEKAEVSEIRGKTTAERMVRSAVDGGRKIERDEDRWREKDEETWGEEKSCRERARNVRSRGERET